MAARSGMDHACQRAVADLQVRIDFITEVSPKVALCYVL